MSFFFALRPSKDPLCYVGCVGLGVRCGFGADVCAKYSRGERFPKAKVEATKAKSALKDTATPEDVAEQVKYLVMSKSITGQNIVIDCGIAI